MWCLGIALKLVTNNAPQRFSCLWLAEYQACCSEVGLTQRGIATTEIEEWTMAKTARIPFPLSTCLAATSEAVAR